MYFGWKLFTFNLLQVREGSKQCILYYELPSDVLQVSEIRTDEFGVSSAKCKDNFKPDDGSIAVISAPCK